MFNNRFNPRFHWQMNREKITHKKILISLLIVISILSVFLIFRKYYFVSGKSIDLEELIPAETKAVLKISTSNLIVNQKDSNQKDSILLNSLFNSGLNLANYLSNEHETDFFINNIDKDIYWMENSPDAQLILFKIKDINLSYDYWKEIINNSKIIEYNKKIIYEYGFDFPKVNNYFLPNRDNQIYISYLNDYIFCISNNLDFVKLVSDRYKEASKIDYLRSIKEELSNYFNEQNSLVLEVREYQNLKESFSWVKNLSFLIQDDQSSFVIKFKVKSKKLELFLNNLDDNQQTIDLSVFKNELLNDFSIYYANLGINYQEEYLNLNQDINYFLKNNIESLYNINFGEEFKTIIGPYYFLKYQNDNFLLLSKDLEKMKSVYKNILAHLYPQSRNMILPDGSSVIEYYSDLNLLELKEQENNDLIWYYADLPGDVDFYLVQYDDWYILTNFREKIVELSKNKEKFYKILNYDYKNYFQELLVLNFNNSEQNKYFPWLDLLPGFYRRLNFVNLTEDGSNKAFLEVIH